MVAALCISARKLDTAPPACAAHRAAQNVAIVCFGWMKASEIAAAEVEVKTEHRA